MKNEFKNGQDAYWAGADSTDNPHAKNTPEFQEWERGFLDAQVCAEEMLYSNDDKFE